MTRLITNVASEGFEPPKLKTADLQSAPFGRLGNLPGRFRPPVFSWPNALNQNSPNPARSKSHKGSDPYRAYSTPASATFTRYDGAELYAAIPAFHPSTPTMSGLARHK
jgi:hypothetical protein